ncbi:MAG: hypothetical protein QXH03_08350 [Candidatus Bathyarchaeia archaeon]
MRVTPGKLVRITQTPTVLGYTYIEHSPILPPGLWYSYVGYSTIEVPAGEVWKTFGVYFTTHHNHFVTALAILCLAIKNDQVYGYTGGTVVYPSALPIAGSIWVPLSELVLTAGTYDFSTRYLITFGRPNWSTFTARVMFERHRA